MRLLKLMCLTCPPVILGLVLVLLVNGKDNYKLPDLIDTNLETVKSHWSSVDYSETEIFHVFSD